MPFVNCSKLSQRVLIRVQLRHQHDLYTHFVKFWQRPTQALMGDSLFFGSTPMSVFLHLWVVLFYSTLRIIRKLKWILANLKLNGFNLLGEKLVFVQFSENLDYTDLPIFRSISCWSYWIIWILSFLIWSFFFNPTGHDTGNPNTGFGCNRSSWVWVEI